MKLRTIVVEDEKPARERLLRSLAEFDEIEVIGQALNGSEALRMIRKRKPDLVFLDVQIPVQTGMEVLKQLEERPHVVFTTAYDEYAIKAFELHAIDYLLKPYGRDRLRDAVERAVQRMKSDTVEAHPIDELVAHDREEARFLERVSVREANRYVVLDTEAVECFKAEDGLVFAVRGIRKNLIDSSLSHLETQLDPEQFLRIHRKAIINLRHIDHVMPRRQGKLSVVLSGGTEVYVSRQRTQQFRRVVGIEL